MAYTEHNYRSKKELKEDIAKGLKVRVFQPGPFGPEIGDGIAFLEGPHYPEAHSWYAQVEVEGGVITKFVS